MDRRVRRTRDALGDALVDLMHEKPFTDITVQQVLDRAGVSRSTFYTHFSDKDDLFLSDVEDFLEMMAFSLSRHGEKSNRVAPVRELFAHVAEWHKFHAVLVAADKMGDFLEMGQGYFARAIEQRLAEIPRARELTCKRRAAISQMFAGALMSSLSWWISHGMPGSAAEMDELYHRMVWQGVGATDNSRASTGS
ncbi:MAG: TetR/AcrR family transcriptional regulator [Acidobacteriia bacterium]|nr:TetR/AcrR family transcriptional regulator [Terriglobia bacterium]